LAVRTTKKLSPYTVTAVYDAGIRGPADYGDLLHASKEVGPMNVIDLLSLLLQAISTVVDVINLRNSGKK
jgi:hypothetical protein